jgi:hypothetical protein
MKNPRAAVTRDNHVPNHAPERPAPGPPLDGVPARVRTLVAGGFGITLPATKASGSSPIAFGALALRGCAPENDGSPARLLFQRGFPAATFRAHP